MTWVLAPLLVGGASTLVAILVRAVVRAAEAEEPAPSPARHAPAAAARPERWAPRGGAYPALRPPAADPHGTTRA